jgi:hypothetical protein
MQTRLKGELEEAIGEILDSRADAGGDDWQYLIHPKLVHQMMNAAEAVFDAAQDAQEYYEREMR